MKKSKTFLIIISVLSLSLQAFNQDSSQMYYAAGMAKSAAGNNCDAIKLFDKAIEFMPSDTAYYIRAQLKSFTFDIQGAVQDYTKGIRLKTIERSDFLADRGFLDFKMGHYRKALRGFKKGAKLRPFGFDIRLQTVRDSLKMYKKEIKEYSRAVKSNPIHYADLGRVKFGLGHYKAAFKDLNKAIELCPKVAYVYFVRAMREVFYGDQAGALADMQKAANLGDSQALRYSTFFCR